MRSDITSTHPKIEILNRIFERSSSKSVPWIRPLNISANQRQYTESEPGITKKPWKRRDGSNSRKDISRLQRRALNDPGGSKKGSVHAYMINARRRDEEYGVSESNENHRDRKIKHIQRPTAT